MASGYLADAQYAAAIGGYLADAQYAATGGYLADAQYAAAIGGYLADAQYAATGGYLADAQYAAATGGYLADAQYAADRQVMVLERARRGFASYLFDIIPRHAGDCRILVREFIGCGNIEPIQFTILIYFALLTCNILYKNTVLIDIVNSFQAFVVQGARALFGLLIRINVIGHAVGGQRLKKTFCGAWQHGKDFGFVKTRSLNALKSEKRT